MPFVYVIRTGHARLDIFSICTRKNCYQWLIWYHNTCHIRKSHNRWIFRGCSEVNFLKYICMVYTHVYKLTIPTCSIEVVKTGIGTNSCCSLLEGSPKLTRTTLLKVSNNLCDIHLLQESSAYGGKAVRMQVPIRGK